MNASFRSCLFALLTVMLPASTFASTTVVDDTFAVAGKSQTQSLPSNFLWLFSGRGNPRNDATAGAVAFTLSSSSSDAYWGFFTGNLTGTTWSNTTPVALNIGDSLSVSATFSTGSAPASDIRFDMFNSAGTRNTANLTGGQNQATFADDLGYTADIQTNTTSAPFSLFKRNPVGSTANPNNPLNALTSGDFAPLTGAGVTNGNGKALAANTTYTITYTYQLTAAGMQITVAMSGGALGANYSYTATDPSVTVSAFDYFTFRLAGSAFASSVTFNRIRVLYTPALPVITAQPTFSTGSTSLNVGVSGQATMSVTATGTGLTYQWRNTGTPVSGATAASLTLTNLQLTDSGNYDVVVTNGGGSVTSSAIALTVTNNNTNPPPQIATQPTSQTANFGSPVTFSVVATGNALTYQWYKNGSAITSATSSSLSFASVQPGDAGTYRVDVANDGGTLPSNNVTLTVLSTSLALGAIFPANGATAQPADSHVTLNFAVPPALGTSGFIKLVDASTNLPVDTIDLSSPRTNFLNLPQQTKTIGTLTGFNYFPVIVTGNQVAVYFRNNVLGYNKNYYITVDPGVFFDAQGIFPGISSPTAWRFTTKASAPASGTTFLTVAADGSGDFATVQGAIDFIPSANTTRTTIFIRRGTYTEIVYYTGKHSLTFLGEDRFQTVVQYPNNNNFNGNNTAHRMVFQADHTNNTVVANLTINNTTPFGGSQAEALFLNGTATSQAIVTGVELNSFQDTLQANGQLYVSNSHISGNTDYMWGVGPNFFYHCELTANVNGTGYYTQIRNPNYTSTHGNVYLQCTLDASPGVTSGLYLGRIDPTVFPFSEVVYLDCVMGGHIRPEGWLLNNASTAPTIHFWEYNSHDAGGNPINVSSRLADSKQLTLANDSTTIANYSTPSYVLGNNWTPQLAPIITAQLTAQTVNLGATITLSIGDVGVPDATFQWLRNGVAIPGATGATYTIASATGADAATYSVVITNSAGAVASAVVPLVVNGGPPVITTDPANQIALTGSSASFAVVATGKGPFSYQWNKNGAPIAGATNRSLQLTNVQATDATNYSVTVSNANGANTSNAATLTLVAPAAALPTQPVIPAALFVVTDYGAIGDGVTDNTAAIQAAISAARTAGGGTIEIPAAAQNYLSGPITLFSNMNFQVDGGATLQALPFLTYPNSLTAPAHFITVTSGSSNVEISGSGTIDGNGAAWWAADNAGTISNRPRLLQFTRATNVLVTSLHLQNPGQFHIAFSSTNTNCTLFGITINTNPNSPNTDGIDPAGSNFLIQNCSIACGDDNIAVKPGNSFVTGLTIANCAFGAGHGLSVGGQTNLGLDGMTVTNCTFNGTQTGLRLKADSTEGGPLQNVTYSNITMTNVPSPIVFYSYYNIVGSPGAASGSNQTTPAKVNTDNTTPPNPLNTTTIPTWKNITIQNLTATGATAYSIIWGLPLGNALIQNVTLNNVHISGGPGFEIYDATNVQFINSSVGAFTTDNALAITGQPQNASTSVGGTVNFAATAIGASGINGLAPTYQWNFNGAPLANGPLADGTIVSGATTAALSLSNVHVAEAGNYSVTVSNNLDGYNVAASSLVVNSLPVSATSSTATLAVQPLPENVAFGDLNFVYDGTQKFVTATTGPVAGLPVSITYNGSLTAPANAGSYTVVATISDPNYVGSATDTLTIAQATPTIAWPTPAAITYGAALGAAQLNATASTSGGFAYSPAAGVILGAGANQTLSVSFTPTDANNYATASATVLITVNKATPTITWPAPAMITFGTALDSTQLNATASTGGTLVYSPAAGTVLSAGANQTLSATFTPSDPANYTSASAATLITVNKATPTITWPTLAAITYGTPLGATQLNATASTAGTFSYSPPAGTVLAAGANHPLNVSFTPSDTTDFTSATASNTITVNQATATIALSGLIQAYDGTPKSVTATTTPSGLTVILTYNGSTTAPTLPGPYAIVATIDDPNYAATLNDTLVITITSLVRHAPTLNGDVDGSLQVLLPESTTLNGSAMISGDLLVPGTPTVQLNGHPTYGSTLDSTGSATPTNYSVTLGGNAVLGHVVRRVDALALPTVIAPPAPAGTRDVTINSAGQSAGDFTTLRNLTLNGNAGAVAILPGTYGNLTANGNSGFVLGLAGATTPAVYNLQNLTLNGSATIQIVGPVILTLANGITLNSAIGAPDYPEWLTVMIASGGATLNGAATLNGSVVAPSGTITLNGNSTLTGTVSSDRLTINGNGLLHQPVP